jgi:hypothetical protein
MKKKQNLGKSRLESEEAKPTSYNNTYGDYAYVAYTITKLTATPTITGNDGTIFILKKTSTEVDNS